MSVEQETRGQNVVFVGMIDNISFEVKKQDGSIFLLAIMIAPRMHKPVTWAMPYYLAML